MPTPLEIVQWIENNMITLENRYIISDHSFDVTEEDIMDEDFAMDELYDFEFYSTQENDNPELLRTFTQHRDTWVGYGCRVCFATFESFNDELTLHVTEHIEHGVERIRTPIIETVEAVDRSRDVMNDGH